MNGREPITKVDYTLSRRGVPSATASRMCLCLKKYLKQLRMERYAPAWKKIKELDYHLSSIGDDLGGTKLIPLQ